MQMKTKTKVKKQNQRVFSFWRHFFNFNCNNFVFFKKGDEKELKNWNNIVLFFEIGSPPSEFRVEINPDAIPTQIQNKISEMIERSLDGSESFPVGKIMVEKANSH